jgi:hypothetical protein
LFVSLSSDWRFWLLILNLSLVGELLLYRRFSDKDRNLDDFSNVEFFSELIRSVELSRLLRGLQLNFEAHTSPSLDVAKREVILLVGHVLI